MSEELVRYESRNGVALITLNRPAKRNALNTPMCAALHAAWTRFALSAEDRAAVITAADDANFCAGADENDPPANFLDAIPEVGIALAKPVIAAVAGDAHRVLRSLCRGGEYPLRLPGGQDWCDARARQRGWPDPGRFDALDKKPPQGYMNRARWPGPIGTICGRACSLNVCKD